MAMDSVTTPCAPADIAVAMHGLQATVGTMSVINGLIIHTWGGVEYKGPVDTCVFLSRADYDCQHTDVKPLDTSPFELNCMD